MNLQYQQGRQKQNQGIHKNSCRNRCKFQRQKSMSSAIFISICIICMLLPCIFVVGSADVSSTSSNNAEKSPTPTPSIEDKEEEEFVKQHDEAVEGKISHDDDDDDEDDDDYEYGEEEDDEEDNDEHNEHETINTKMNRKTLINLHDKTIEENKDLTLDHNDTKLVAKQVVDRISVNIEKRLEKLFEKAKTPECRAKIGEHFSLYINGIGTEYSLPFYDSNEYDFIDECPETKYHDFTNLPEGMHFGHIQNRTYRPPANETEYIDDPNNLVLCYAIMTHENANSTIRLIESLYDGEDGMTTIPKNANSSNIFFVIHVDGKESSDETYRTLKEYASKRSSYVHILDNEYRVRVNWGGYSMVNATIQMLQYIFALTPQSQPRGEPLFFHKFVHIASTTYPLASNIEIRNTLASYPIDANLMHVIMKPTNPHPHSWHHFIECDDAVHRIYRLKPLTQSVMSSVTKDPSERKGIDIHTSSQWFIISYEFAKYIAEDKPGTLAHKYHQYVQQVVVADESYFGTLLRNTKFCTKHHNWNYLHLQFDRWESDLDDVTKRDERKCLMPSPDHCGRSPTTMTIDYMDMLELSDDLFARKFEQNGSGELIKDVIDKKRAKEEKGLREGKQLDEIRKPNYDHTFEGEGILIVAKETVNDDMPLCLGLGESGNKVRIVPCFHEFVPETLADGWETGAVIVEETIPNNRWELGPCSSDGSIKRLESGEIDVTSGLYSPMGPRCMLKQMDGIRVGRCIDGESEHTKPGGEIQVYPCVRKWNQFVSFGTGKNETTGFAPKGSLHTTIPSHIVRHLRVNKNKDQEPYLCMGVKGRGDPNDEDDSDEEEEDEEEIEGENTREKVKHEGNQDETNDSSKEKLSLINWEGEQVYTTRCSNVDAVIEWLYIPFIIEEREPDIEKESHEEQGSKEPDISNNDIAKGNKEEL